MSQASVVLPPVPADTQSAADRLVQPGDRHLLIGDRAEELLAGVDLSSFDRSEDHPLAALARLALATCLQFLAGLSDVAAAEALQSRVDWKYALHLPLDHPGFPAKLLCGFRQRLWLEAEAEAAFSLLLTHLADSDLMSIPGGADSPARRVLLLICARARATDINAAMRRALEALAVYYPEWLRTHALAHWYERYNRASSFLSRPQVLADWEAVTVEIGNDVKYVLTHLPNEGRLDPQRLPEISELYLEWLRQYTLCRDGAVRRSPLCNDCRGFHRPSQPASDSAYEPAPA